MKFEMTISWIELISSRLYRQKIAFVVLLIFRYVFVVRLVRDLIAWHDCSNQLFHQKLHLQNAWTRHDTELFSNQLYHQKNCIVVLLIVRYFLAVRLVRNSIIHSWLCDDVVILTWLFSSQLFYQMNCIYKTFERVTISTTIRVNCIVKKFASVCRRLRYVFAVWFDHNLLSMSMCFDWYMNSKLLFLTKLFFFNHYFVKKRDTKNVNASTLYHDLNDKFVIWLFRILNFAYSTTSRES